MIALHFVKRSEFYADCPAGYGIALFLSQGRAVYVATRSEHRCGDDRVAAVELYRKEAPEGNETARKLAFHECVAVCEDHFANRSRVAA